MNDFISGIDREQSLLLPSRIEDYVSDDNPVRFIDVFVDSLDLQSLGFTHAILAEGAGRPSYNPGDMLKLYIWGYLNQIRSSRKLEIECHRNLEVMWLINGLSPDFKTIADFRKDNVDSIKEVFREFTKLCTRLDLFGNELVGIDGMKIKAVNSRTRNFNAENLESRIKRVEERLAEYMKNIDENDKVEHEKAEHLTREELKEKIEKKAKEKYLSLKQELKDKNIKEVSLTDPDSRLMKLPNNGFDICYNVQAAVDKKSHLIVSYDVVNSSSDYNQLSSMALKAKEALNAKNLTVIADMGYFDSNEIKAYIDNGITPFVPERKYASPTKYSTGVPAPEFGEDKFVYNRDSDSYTCPAGFELKYFKTKFNYGRRIRMFSTQACNSKCLFRAKCTAAKGGRIIYRWEHHDIIDKMNDVMKTPEGKALMTLRRELVEHPFGTIKRAFNQGYLLLRGLKKVQGEIAFTMLTYNMRRLINLLGTQTLMTALS